jgi:hypothetical protein
VDPALLPLPTCTGEEPALETHDYEQVEFSDNTPGSVHMHLPFRFLPSVTDPQVLELLKHLQTLAQLVEP